MSTTSNICLPPTDIDECEVCHLCEDDFEDECPEFKLKLLRCSVCKNRFFCSADCQKSDWKTHKINCTKLPSEPLELPKIAIPLVELDAEANRANDAVYNAWKEIEAVEPADYHKKPISPAEVKRLPGIKRLAKYTLSDAVAWPNTYTIQPLNHVLASISRLFLSHHIAHLQQMSTTDENFAESLALLETHLDYTSAHLPPGFTRLVGPKVTRLPGELGVAEYMMLSQMMMVYMLTIKNDKPEGQKWARLVNIMTRLKM